MLRVAIVGSGNVGRIRAGVIHRSPHSRVRIVADVQAGLARELAQTLDAEPTSNWRYAVQHADIDVVVVCTPTKFHAEIANIALGAGKHVLCEKPLARSVAEAEAMINTAEGAHRLLKTGFNYRHMAHVRKAKEQIEAGVLGPLHFLRCRFGHGGRPGYEKAWCTNLELSGGGALLEQGIHIVDLIRYLLGEPAEVCAETACLFWNFPEVEDNCFLLMKTDTGQLAQAHVSWTQWRNVFALEIFGRDGYLILSGRDGHYGPQQLILGKRQPNHGRPQEQVFEFGLPDDSWKREWDEFVGAIHDDREPLGSGFDGLRALHLVQACYTSSQSHGWVEVTRLRDRVSRTA